MYSRRIRRANRQGKSLTLRAERYEAGKGGRLLPEIASPDEPSDNDHVETDGEIIDLEKIPLRESDLAIGTMDSNSITEIKTQLVEFSLVFEKLLASLWKAYMLLRDMATEAVLRHTVKETFDQLPTRYENTIWKQLKGFQLLSSEEVNQDLAMFRIKQIFGQEEAMFRISNTTDIIDQYLSANTGMSST